MQLFQRVDAVRDPATFQLDRRYVERVVIADGECGHGEAVRSGRGVAIGFERLPPRRDVEHAIPLQLLAGGEDGIEMSAMEGVEGAADDADSHIAGTAGSTTSSTTRFSRTKRASLRTSSRTFSPPPAEIAKESSPVLPASGRI